MQETVEYDHLQFYTDDPVFRHSITHGYTEPFPIHLTIVKKYVNLFPHKNRTYIDIGAHIGTTIMPYSRIFEKVVGYEAHPTNYEYLLKNVALNKVTHAKIFNTALFSEECRGIMVKAQNANSGCYSFERSPNGYVLAKTLDGECERKKIENVDFIKIDTHGYESLVLQSGKNTILKHKPFLQIATDSTSTYKKETVDFLRDLGYIMFDDSDVNNIFMFCPNETLSIIPKTIYTFWTGTNPMSENRIHSLEQLKTVSEGNVKLINTENLSDYLLATEPLHPAYPYLSETHKADYLRTYFMHFYGGGYCDIKRTLGSWRECFEIMGEPHNEYLACGYPEIGPYGTGVLELKSGWEKLIGNGAYILKPNTEFTRKWYSTLIQLLDSKLEALKLHPATYPQDTLESGSGYPIDWNEMLGQIFHRINYAFHNQILKRLPGLHFDHYR